MNIIHRHTHVGAWSRMTRKCARSAFGSWVLAAIVVAAVSGGVFAEPIPVDPVRPVAMESPIRLLPDRQVYAGLALQVGAPAYQALRGQSHVRLNGFPLDQHKIVDLELEQFTVTSPTTKFVLGTDDGDRPAPHPDVVLFRGRVVEEPGSRVFLGISATHSNGYIALPGKEYILAPSRVRGKNIDAAHHVLYERFAAGANAPPSPFQCQTRTPREPAANIESQSVEAQAAYTWRAAFVAIECDYEYGQAFDSTSDAFVYVLELLGAISSVYERDLQVRLVLPYIRIWQTVSDPYTANDVGPLLDQFTAYWSFYMGGVDRDIAHFLTPKQAGGGMANVDVLCSNAWGYGASSGISGVFPRPLEDGSLEQWDVHVVSHEMGHQFGSPHTHCYNPPIDNCGQSFDDCWNGIYACQQGTIMSYCKSCPGGLANMDIRFHGRVITRIRQSVDASCLRSGMNPVYVDWAHVGFEFGTQLFPFNTALEGIRIVIPGGTVYFDTGAYPEWIRANRPMVLRTTGGPVVLGP